MSTWKKNDGTPNKLKIEQKIWHCDKKNYTNIKQSVFSKIEQAGH